MHDLLYCARTVPVLVVHDRRGARAAGVEAFLRGRHNGCCPCVAYVRHAAFRTTPRETASALERFWHPLPPAAFERVDALISRISR